MFGTTLPWSVQSRMTVWFVSTQASKPDAAAAPILARTWDHDPSTRVVRSLALNAAGQMVVESVVNTSTIMDYYKDQVKRLVEVGYKPVGAEAIDTALVVLPWWQPARNLQQNAIEISRLAEQHELAERYRIEQGLPPFQDYHSYLFLEHCMPNEQFAIEMLNQKNGANTDNSKMQAFDTYSVHVFAEKARRRIASPAHEFYAQFYPGVETARPAHLKEYYFGPGTVAPGKPPRVYIFYDPAQGGKSEAVLVSAIYRSLMSEEAIEALNKPGQRRYEVIEQLHKYNDSVQTCVRSQLFHVTHMKAPMIMIEAHHPDIGQEIRRRHVIAHEFQHRP